MTMIIVRCRPSSLPGNRTSVAVVVKLPIAVLTPDPANPYPG